jgi:hypothetical protein
MNQYQNWKPVAATLRLCNSPKSGTDLGEMVTISVLPQLVLPFPAKAAK